MKDAAGNDFVQIDGSVRFDVCGTLFLSCKALASFPIARAENGSDERTAVVGCIARLNRTGK